MSAADPYLHFSRHDQAFTGFIHGAQITVDQCELDSLLLPGLQMDPLESLQHSQRCARNAKMSQIDLHNFITSFGAGILYVYGQRNRIRSALFCMNFTLRTANISGVIAYLQWHICHLVASPFCKYLQAIEYVSVEIKNENEEHRHDLLYGTHIRRN